MRVLPWSRRWARGEPGETLIEVLVAVAIMGLAFVVILGGIGTAIIGADVQKQQAGADLALRSAAETITYQPCAASYPDQTPPGFVVEVTRVSYWDPGSNQFDVDPPASCSPPSPSDSGLQLLDLTVTSASGRPTSETLQVVKRQP